MTKLKPSPAMVIAMLALFVALTGTSAAVVSLIPARSVGTVQLRKNAVISSKVKNHSLKAVDFAPGQLPRGLKGDPGANGVNGINGVGTKGDTGETGATGAKGGTGARGYTGTVYINTGDSPTQEIASTSRTDRIRVAGYPGSPQEILTLPAAQYNGAPVEMHLSIDYANFIPDGTISCGLFFFLYDGGAAVSVIGTFGAHYTTQGRFSPIELTDVLEGARAPTAGLHTFSIRVAKWSPTEDDYLVAGAGQNGEPKPMRLDARYN